MLSGVFKTGWRVLANIIIVIPNFTFINIVQITILLSPYYILLLLYLFALSLSKQQSILRVSCFAITIDKTNNRLAIVLSMLETSSICLFRNSEYLCVAIIMAL